MGHGETGCPRFAKLTWEASPAVPAGLHLIAEVSPALTYWAIFVPSLRDLTTSIADQAFVVHARSLENHPGKPTLPAVVVSHPCSA